MEVGNPEASSQLLKQKYDLHKAPEVTAAARRTEARTGERVPQDPLVRIQNYLDRLDHIIHPTHLEDHPQFDRKERNLNLLTKGLYDRYVIKPENISDEYIKNTLLGNEADLLGYERGQLQDAGVKTLVLKSLQEKIHSPLESYKVPPEVRQELETMIITDQKARMRQWIDYLASDEARHAPKALRYWAFKEMLKMGDYDPVRNEYNKRNDATVANFPELDQQALSLVFDEVTRKYKKELPGLVIEDDKNREKLKALLQSENFSNLYAFMQEHVSSLKLPAERLVVTNGEWRTFSQGSDPKALTDSLSGFQTKWCIAGEGYAQSYLKNSDVTIYYSQDAEGNNTIPRACIVRNNEHQRITEVRGIIFNDDVKQHLDDYITPVVEEKLQTLDGGKEWTETMKDMKRLSEVHLKHLHQELLDRDDLIFLYQIDHQIKSSGYGGDPRIEKLRNQRNPELDMPVVFGCEPSQIAHSPNDIRPDTRAYIGPLVPGIFDRLQAHIIEHVYTSFPEGKITMQQIEIGGKTKEQLQQELEQTGVCISSYARDMMRNPDFTTLPIPQALDTVRLKVGDLGLSGYPTTDQVYRKAQELGLDLCPAEVGPHMRLQTKDQPIGDYYWIGMKQITDSNGYPNVFLLARSEDVLWLYDDWAGPDCPWRPRSEFVFGLRKSETQNPQTLSSLLKNLLKR